MKKQLTVWQCTMLVAVCIVATKFQRFPALIAKDYGNNGWVYLLLMLLFDLLFVWLLVSSLTKLKDKTFFELLEEKLGKVVKTIICVIVAFYFFFKSVVTYRGTHEFFANMLFDKLSWFYFSILFALLLIIMVGGGLNNIGRSAELYSYIIAFGLITSIILGILKVDLWNIMPIMDMDVGVFAKSSIKHLPWLGDYLVILLFIGNVKIDKNPVKPIMLSYIATSLLIVTVYIIFYCINESLSVYQANSLSAITQYSLIGLGVGRPDWFLVLFVFLSTIIANAFYVYAYTLSVSEIFNLKRSYLFISSMVFVLFIVDNIVLKNIQSSLSFMHNYVSFLALFVGISMPILVKCLAGKSNVSAIKKKHRDKAVYYKERCAIWLVFSKSTLQYSLWYWL